MEFIVILVVIGLQRFAKLNSYSRQYDWMTPYYSYLKGKVIYITKGHPLVGSVIILMPVILLVAIVFALIYGLLNTVGYFIANAVLLWYFLDARDLHKEPYSQTDEQAIFVHNYQVLFARLFWFYFFGPVGLSLYVATMLLLDTLAKAESANGLSAFVTKLLAVLDWVPIRLVGLSYALVGNFTAVFKSWLQHAWQGLQDSPRLIATWGKIALSADKQSEQTPASLVDRALLVWLVAIAILAVHAWIS